MSEPLERPQIEAFRDLVAHHMGLYFQADKLDFLADVLRQRMRETHCHDLATYEKQIKSRREMRQLADHLTVGETYFFRNIDHFRAFIDLVIPERMCAQGQARQLDILSAGCASGEEAYSLSILLRENVPQLAGWQVKIRAIDINASMLEKAQRGRYSTWALRETPAYLQAKYFHSESRDLLLDGALKDSVSFEERNLVEHDPAFWQPESFDVVFCRNVTMYFAPDVTRQVIDRIAKSLRPGGYLFLGHAETLRGISHAFHLRHTHDTFYYQRKDASEMLSDVPAAHQAPSSLMAMVGEPQASWVDVIQRASERIARLTDAPQPGAAPVAPVAPKQKASAPPPTPPWDLSVALELLRRERFAEALQALRTLPPEANSDADAQLLRAVLLTHCGELDNADQVCRELLVIDELNAGAHYVLALSAEHAGNRQSAIEHAQAAAYLDNGFAMPHLHLGMLAKRASDMPTARREFAQALTLLAREDAARVLFFGGGFSRDALIEFCRAELHSCGGAP